LNWGCAAHASKLSFGQLPRATSTSAAQLHTTVAVMPALTIFSSALFEMIVPTHASARRRKTKPIFSFAVAWPALAGAQRRAH
jgi:hypothetical protein